MKMLGWMLAVTLLATGLAATAAAAQPERVRVVEKTRTYYESDRKWGGGDHKWRGGDRKWRGSERKWDNSSDKWRWRTSCRTQWHNGHRERACRRLRYHAY